MRPTKQLQAVNGWQKQVVVEKIWVIWFEEIKTSKLGNL